MNYKATRLAAELKEDERSGLARALKGSFDRSYKAYLPLCKKGLVKYGGRITDLGKEVLIALAEVPSRWKRFPVGSTVAHKELFPNVIHEGVVASVKISENGYPVTRVNFPKWKGEIEIHTSFLCTPDQFQSNVNWWAN